MGLFGTDIGPNIDLSNPKTLGQAVGGRLLGLPGLLAGGAIGDMFNSPGGPNMPAPNRELTTHLASYQSQLNKSPEQIQNEALANTGSAAGALGFDPTNQALSHRASRIFNQNMGDLNTKAMMSSQIQANQQRGHALDMTQQLANYQRGIDVKVQQLQMDAEGARNSMLGQLFGGLGQGVGLYAAISSRQSSGGMQSSQAQPLNGSSNLKMPQIGDSYNAPQPTYNYSTP